MKFMTDSAILKTGHFQCQVCRQIGRKRIKLDFHLFSELDHWTAHAGLHFVDFNFKRDKYLLSVQNLDLDEDRIALNKLNFMENYAFAELFHGSFDNHNFYISKQKDSVATIEDPNNVAYLNGKQFKLEEKLEEDLVKVSKENPKRLSNLEYEISSFMNHGKFPISLPLSNFTQYYIDYLIEGKLSTGDMLEEIEKKQKISKELIMSELREFYNNISSHDLLLLRDKTVNDIDVLRNVVIFRF